MTRSDSRFIAHQLDQRMNCHIQEKNEYEKGVCSEHWSWTRLDLEAFPFELV